jgi:hypothetical protein
MSCDAQDGGVRLRRELLVVLTIKIILLAVIWRVFVHDATMKVDAEIMARHMISAPYETARGGRFGH